MHPLVDFRKLSLQPFLSFKQAPLPASEPGPNPELALSAFYVISDTHMDFGWFAPNILIQRKNYAVLEEVRKKIEAEPDHRFSLEAMWMVEAYARQATPKQFRSLRRLMHSAKLSVAPHYVLLDDRLAGERAQIYNVLVGRRVAAFYDVVPSSIFCAKDIFGLDAQTPQRERKLGNDMVFRARGDVPDVEDAIVHVWLAADGKSWIYDVRQPGGYGNGARLGHRPTEASATIYSRPVDNSPEARNDEAARSIIAHDTRYSPKYREAGLPAGVLFNGCDYERIQPDIGEVVEYLAQRFPGVTFRLATFDEYGKLVRCLDPALLETYQGDLFGAGAANIRDVEITRIPTIKVPYAAAVQLLTEAEALAAFATYAGVMEDVQGYLTDAWKDVLAVGTHDYLSGSVTDYVMPEISFLLWGAQEKARRIVREALGRMATGLEARYNDLEIVGERYSLINLSPYPQTGLVELPVPLSLWQSPRLQLRTETGDVLPVQVKANGSGKRALAVVDVPGFQGSQVTLEEAAAAAPGSPEEEPGENEGIQNEYLAVEACPGGLIVKKHSGVEHRVWFDLVRDRGDSYTAEALDLPPWDSRLAAEDARPVEVTRGSLVQELRAGFEVRVPASLTEERQKLSETDGLMQVTLTARLASGLDRLQLKITVHNVSVDDYILRLLVATPQGNDFGLARDNFMVRPVCPVEVEGEAWQARNSSYEFDAGGLIAGDVALAGQGLFAHRLEARDNELTIIKPIQRGIGYVSRDDLLKRKGAAAAQRDIPQAQCHGEYTYAVYLSLNGDTMDENMLVRWSDEVLKGLVVGMEGVTLEQAPQVLEGNAVITGIKQPEDGSADLIYHVGNYGPHPAYLVFDRAVEPCLLNEGVLGIQPDPLVCLGPYEFGAVRVKK